MEKKVDDFLVSPIALKYFKIGGIVIGGFVALYLLGHILKISAHTINGYHQLKSAIKNGKQNI